MPQGGFGYPLPPGQTNPLAENFAPTHTGMVNDTVVDAGSTAPPAPEQWVADPGPDPASAPDSSFNLPKSGTYGIGGIQSKIGELANQSPYPPELMQAIGDNFEARKKTTDDYGKEVGKVEAQLQGLALTQARVNQERQSALNQAEMKLAKVGKRAQYANLSLDEIERLEGIANDNSGRYLPEQKRAAQLALKRASEIDPNRLLNSSTKNKVLAVLATTLGAAGTAMSGGRNPNFGMQLIQDAIDRDIMAQKFAFENADRTYQRERSLYADLRANFETETQAMNAQRSMLLGSAEMLARKYGAVTQAEELAAKSLEFKMKVSEESFTRRLDALSKQAAVARDRRHLDIADGRAQQQRAALDSRVPGLFLTGERQPTKQDTAKVTANKPIYDAFFYKLRELIQLREKHGSEHGGGPIQSKMESLRDAAIFDVAKLAEQGALQAPDKALAESIIGNVTGVGWQQARLEAAFEHFYKRAESFYRTHGYGLEK